MALDVATPVDFTDPDHSFLDNLPQPYRLIVGVLDAEVSILSRRALHRSHRSRPARMCCTASRASDRRQALREVEGCARDNTLTLRGPDGMG